MCPGAPSVLYSGKINYYQFFAPYISLLEKHRNKLATSVFQQNGVFFILGPVAFKPAGPKKASLSGHRSG